MNPSSRKLFVLLALLAMTAFPRFAEAQTLVWNGGDGTWNTPASWSTGIVPNSNVDAALDSNFTLSLPASVSGTARTLYIGWNSIGRTPVLSISGGSLTTTTGVIANSLENASVEVSSGTWTNSGQLTIGNSGTGTMTVDGGYVSTGTTVIGSGSHSSGVLVVNSGSFSNGSNGNFIIGGTGTGSVTVNGGTVFAGGNSNFTEVSIGYAAGSSGSLTITGGTWNGSNFPDTRVGESGTGGLLITAAGITAPMLRDSVTMPGESAPGRSIGRHIQQRRAISPSARVHSSFETGTSGGTGNFLIDGG